MDRRWYSFHLVSVLAALTAALIIIELDFQWGLRSRPYTPNALLMGITAISAGLMVLLVLEYAIQSSTKGQPSKRLKQFHLSSAVAALVIFGAWLMLNTVPGKVSYGGDRQDDVVGRITEYGWPFASYGLLSPRFTYDGGAKFEPLSPEQTASSLFSVSPLEFFCNALVYCLATVIAVSILERRIL